MDALTKWMIHITPNHHPGHTLPKWMFSQNRSFIIQIILAAKWLVQHSYTSSFSSVFILLLWLTSSYKDDICNRLLFIWSDCGPAQTFDSEECRCSCDRARNPAKYSCAQVRLYVDASWTHGTVPLRQKKKQRSSFLFEGQKLFYSLPR